MIADSEKLLVIGVLTDYLISKWVCHEFLVRDSFTNLTTSSVVLNKFRVRIKTVCIYRKASYVYIDISAVDLVHLAQLRRFYDSAHSNREP